MILYLLYPEMVRYRLLVERRNMIETTGFSDLPVLELPAQG